MSYQRDSSERRCWDTAFNLIGWMILPADCHWISAAFRGSQEFFLPNNATAFCLNRLKQQCPCNNLLLSFPGLRDQWRRSRRTTGKDEWNDKQWFRVDEKRRKRWGTRDKSAHMDEKRWSEKTDCSTANGRRRVTGSLSLSSLVASFRFLSFFTGCWWSCHAMITLSLSASISIFLVRYSCYLFPVVPCPLQSLSISRDLLFLSTQVIH